MNEGQAPITTATAKLVIEPDLSKWNEAKDQVERDIAAMSEKFKAAFTVQLEDFGEKIAAEIAKLETARGSSEGSQQAQATDRSADRPDQLLAHITIIENNTERIAKATEEFAEAFTQQP